jgi:hypothetical protein
MTNIEQQCLRRDVLGKIGNLVKGGGLVGIGYSVRGALDTVMHDPRIVEQTQLKPSASTKFENVIYLIDGITAASGIVSYKIGKHLSRRNLIKGQI